MPWRTANAALTRYRRLCETLRSKQKTMADLERSLPAPVAPVNAARCARLKGVDKQLDLYRRTSRLLNTQTMKRAALMLVKVVTQPLFSMCGETETKRGCRCVEELFVIIRVKYCSQVLSES
ncbi:hypothetical protein HPB52_015340 [Rhipicephalus sanguineus]|uniref:Uncharacterized protein n=1 Tax=Rhipicephalus sanguineus TaxID=34632 RepID=A0A9D4PJQ6_RHISA|nr:hypothetical protein HPB52_015340 [Rhipicephalus sanguineus]